MLYRMGVIMLLMLAAGCGTGPETSKVAAFGAAATSTVSVIGETGRLENDLAVAYATEINACRYLQAQHYTIAPKRLDPVEPRMKAQEEFLKALSGYAAALSKATDPNAVANLKAAANQLTGSASKFLAAASPVAPGAALAAPVFKAGVDTLVHVSEAQRMKEIRKIAAEVDPLLLDAAFIIREDDEKDAELLRRRLLRWEAAAKCNLQNMGQDRAGAYQQFMALNKAKREFEVRKDIADQRADAIVRLAQAHTALATGSEDLRSVTESINAFVDGIAGLRAAVGKGSASQ